METTMPVSNKIPTSPTTQTATSLSDKIASVPPRHDNSNPLWKGPCGSGPLGGITQSMIVRFLSCRERFRLKYILGLEPPDKWVKTIGYGNMWHACEEVMAKGMDVPSIFAGQPVRTGNHDVWDELAIHTEKMVQKYPLQQPEIMKWYNVCKVQFPEYAKYWSEHPDVQNRTPLMQEQVFDVPYTLPSGRVVRLRGKFDSVDLINSGPNIPRGVYIQENKTKGDIDKQQVERQLKFDLQTMLYIISLFNQPSCDLHRKGYYRHGGGTGNNGTVTAGGAPAGEYPILGVRYNVIRRPLSGGVGNIKPHAAKYTKNTSTPAESDEAFYERLRRDYIAADPSYWFFRVRAEVSEKDIKVFRDTCLDPILEQLCWWYDETTDKSYHSSIYYSMGYKPPPMSYRTPFGVWSSLEEGGSTEYDAYLETGSEAGLRRVETLFTELQC